MPFSPIFTEICSCERQPVRCRQPGSEVGAWESEKENTGQSRRSDGDITGLCSSLVISSLMPDFPGSA